MDRLEALLESLRATVLNPQFPVIVFTALVVAAGVIWGRRWYVNRSNGGHTRGILIDAFAVASPYLVGLAIIGFAGFMAGEEPRPWFDTA